MKLLFEIFLGRVKKAVAIITAVVTLVTGAWNLYINCYEIEEIASGTLNTLPEDLDPQAPKITIAENGMSEYKIIYAENAYRSEKSGAEELKKYLDECCGTDIEIFTDSVPESSKEIIVGKTNRTVYNGIDYNELGDDGYTIRIQGEKLVISGGEQRGTIYGVFGFLEDFLGCRWFSTEVSLIPKSNKLSINKNTNIKEIPAFEFRDTTWMCTWNAEWRAQARLNGSTTAWHSPLMEDYVDALNYAGGDCGHTFRFFVPEALFDTRPELFALNSKGERTPGQVCLSNPEVYERTIAMLRDWLNARPDCEYVSVSQNDNQDFCCCSECSRVDKEENSPAGTLIRFVNAVAAELEEEFPNVLFQTFAYQYTRKPPEITKPAHNVLIQLCSIECNHSAPYKDKDPDFVSDLSNWSESAENLFIWDYNTNYKHYLSPFPDIYNMQSNIQLYSEYGVQGVFMQANSMSVNGEFGELRAYLISKLLWNPYCDLEKHMEEFLWGYYGAGYKNIKAYIDFLHENSNDDFGIFDDTDKTIEMSPREIKMCDAYWDAAEDAAANEAELLRIQRSRLQFRYYKNVNRRGEFSFSNLLTRKQASEELYNDIKSFGIIYLREGRLLFENPDFSKTANNWH